MVVDDRMPLEDGEVPQMKMVRFRTLGCYPLTGAVGITKPILCRPIIQEMLLTKTSERQGRMIDHDSVRLDGEEEAGGLLLMAHQSDLIAEDIHAYLKSQEEKDLLRFITCGSVDDGKSTLIGRLLYDSKLIFEDQLASVTADSKKGRDPGRRDRPGAAGRWPPGRARTGHHH